MYTIRGACKLFSLAGHRLLAHASCYISVKSIGRWEGSLTLLEELEPVESPGAFGPVDVELELDDGRGGVVQLIPMDHFDPLLRRKMYTFKGLSLPPNQSAGS